MARDSRLLDAVLAHRSTCIGYENVLGVLMPHLDGVPQERVLRVGEGIAGSAAARAFLALECAVTVLGQSTSRLKALEAQWVGHGKGIFRTGLATSETLVARSVMDCAKGCSSMTAVSSILDWPKMRVGLSFHI